MDKGGSEGEMERGGVDRRNGERGRRGRVNRRNGERGREERREEEGRQEKWRGGGGEG